MKIKNNFIFIKIILFLTVVLIFSGCEPQQQCSNEGNVYFHNERMTDFTRGGAYCVCSDSYYIVTEESTCDCLGPSELYTKNDICDSEGCKYLLNKGCFTRAGQIMSKVEIRGTYGNVLLCDDERMIGKTACIAMDEDNWEEQNYCGNSEVSAICCTEDEDDYYYYDEVCKCRDGDTKYPEFDEQGLAQVCTGGGKEVYLENALVEEAGEILGPDYCKKNDICTEIDLCYECDVCGLGDGCYCYCEKDNTLIPHKIGYNVPCDCSIESEDITWSTMTDIRFKYVFFIVPMGSWDSEDEVSDEIEKSLNVLTKISKFKLNDVDYHIIPLNKINNDEKCNKINSIELNNVKIYKNRYKIINCIKDYISEKNIRYGNAQYIYVGYDSRNSANVGGFATLDSILSLSGDNFFYVGYKESYNIFTHEFIHLFGICDEYDIIDYKKESIFMKCPNEFPSYCESKAACKQVFGNDVDFCKSDIMHNCPGNFIQEIYSDKKLDDCFGAVDNNDHYRSFSIMGTKACGLDSVVYDVLDPHRSLD